VDTSPPRKHPQNVSESKIILEAWLQNFFSGTDVLPAGLTHTGSRAAGSDGVVVIHIDIDDVLSFFRDCLLVSKVIFVYLRRNVANRADINTDRVHLLGVGLEGLWVIVAEVSDCELLLAIRGQLDVGNFPALEVVLLVFVQNFAALSHVGIGEPLVDLEKREASVVVLLEEVFLVEGEPQVVVVLVELYFHHLFLR